MLLLPIISLPRRRAILGLRTVTGKNTFKPVHVSYLVAERRAHSRSLFALSEASCSAVGCLEDRSEQFSANALRKLDTIEYLVINK